jgi:hypothetical protein
MGDATEFFPGVACVLSDREYGQQDSILAFIAKYDLS